MSKEIQCNTSHVVPACMSCSAYRSSIFQGGHATCNRTKRVIRDARNFCKDWRLSEPARRRAIYLRIRELEFKNSVTLKTINNTGKNKMDEPMRAECTEHMSSPEQCKGCYREQRCDLWRNKTLRQQIEAEGCDYFQDHAITNFELFSSEIEALANAMVFETMPHVWRFRIGEMISVQSFSSTDEAKQAAVEYLQQAVDSM